MEEDIRRSSEAGFSHHLVKPVDITRLDSIIQDGSFSDGAAPAVRSAALQN